MCRLVASALGVLIGCTDVSTSVDHTPAAHVSRVDGHRAILDAFGATDVAYVVSERQLPARDAFYRHYRVEVAQHRDFAATIASAFFVK